MFRENTKILKTTEGIHISRKKGITYVFQQLHLQSMLPFSYYSWLVPISKIVWETYPGFVAENVISFILIFLYLLNLKVFFFRCVFCFQTKYCSRTTNRIYHGFEMQYFQDNISICKKVKQNNLQVNDYAFNLDITLPFKIEPKNMLVISLSF